MKLRLVPNIRPCVGCGYCCIKSKCMVGIRLYPNLNPCLSLVWSESKNRYMCDLMSIPGIIGNKYREELYEGAGCFSGLNTWRLNVIKRDKL